MDDLLSRLNSALEGRYRIERKLGEGGMATVYLAADLKHERKVALKVLKPELAAVVGADRFLTEIKTTANLQHPHILPLYDSGEAGSNLFYVMPYLEGESLRQRLDREHQLPIDDAVRIARNVAEALDYAHRQGVIHRDIKPANVLLHDGKPVVADFGIALAVGSAGGGRLTETGLSLGTPHYMSPEQATGDQHVGPPTDIYALGCVLYEMVTGEPPQTGSTPQAILGKVLAGEIAPVTKQRPSVPRNLAASIRKALEPVPADRFPSGQAFARSMEDPNFRHGEKGDPKPHSAPRLWIRISVVLGAATLLLALGLVSRLLRRDSSNPAVRVSVKAPGAQVYSGGLALSSDGSFLVYSARDPEEETSRLWMRAWNSLHATPVDGSAGAISPAVSPDGREILFCSPSGVRVVSVRGGESRTLAQGALAGTAWSSDGAWIYFADLFSGLKRVPAKGGPVESITVVDTAAGERGHADPQVLPGDRGLLFAVAREDGIEIAAVDMETREIKRLGPGTSQRYSPTGHLLFIDNDGTLLAAPFDVGKLEVNGAAQPLVRGMAMANPPRGFYAISKVGSLVYLSGGISDRLTPVWVARDGTSSEIDPGWRTTGLVSSVALSPTADRLAISIQDTHGAYDLWVKHLDRGPLSRATFEGSVNRRAAWNQNGQLLTFISNRAGQFDLWEKRADGSGSAEVLLDREAAVSEGFFSRDRTWLIFEEIRNDTRTSDILAIRPSVDSVPFPIVVRSGFNALAPALSPDGRWLAYVSDDSGREEVYVRPFPNAESGRWLLSSGGGTEPLWAHSGAELFYRNGEHELIAVQVRADSSFAWDHQEVLFSAEDFLARTEHPMYDVSPDDRRFVMLRSSGDGLWELILVQDFFEDLKRQVPN
jgi:serine/threonine-protein kinase